MSEADNAYYAMKQAELKPTLPREPKVGEQWYAVRGGCSGVIKVEVLEITLGTIAIQEVSNVGCYYIDQPERYVKGYINFLEKLG
jgi:hypothetical protein